MAIRKLTNSAYLATNWQDEVESKNILKHGLYQIKFSTSNSNNITILAGSSIDVNGSIYKFDTSIDTSISGLTDGIFYYLYAYESGSTILLELSTTEPIFDVIKMGFYNSTKRAVGCTTFTSGTGSITNSVVGILELKNRELENEELTYYRMLKSFNKNNINFYSTTDINTITNLLIQRILVLYTSNSAKTVVNPFSGNTINYLSSGTFTPGTKVNSETSYTPELFYYNMCNLCKLTLNALSLDTSKYVTEPMKGARININGIYNTTITSTDRNSAELYDAPKVFKIVNNVLYSFMFSKVLDNNLDKVAYNPIGDVLINVYTGLIKG